MSRGLGDVYKRQDDVDGYIYIYSEKLDYIHAGDIIEIEITKADSYDLYARLKNKVTN